MADVLPAAAEDPLLLAAEDLRVDVPGVGKRLLDRANLPAYHEARELPQAPPEGVRRAAARAAGRVLRHRRLGRARLPAGRGRRPAQRKTRRLRDRVRVRRRLLPALRARVDADPLRLG